MVARIPSLVWGQLQRGALSEISHRSARRGFIFSKDRMGARVRAREKSALRSMGSHFRNWAVYSAKSLRENYLRKTGRVGPELPLGAVTAGCVKRAEARFST